MPQETDVDVKRCRLLYINGVWKLRFPDGSMRDATDAEVKVIFPKQLLAEDE